MSQSPDYARELPKQRVLVVDDEPTLRLGFAYALTSKTTAVEIAATGRQALEKLAENSFDILLLDLRMPDMDGLAVIDSLRREGSTVPIVLCSAALHGSAALRSIQHGVVDFLLKPVRPIDLRQVIEFVLRPERKASHLAMKAARSRNFAAAIQLLEGEDHLDRQMAWWLRVFTAVRDHQNGAAAQILNESLPVLAFNSTNHHS